MVIIDFQAKLGIEYPDFDKPDALDMLCFKGINVSVNLSS